MPNEEMYPNEEQLFYREDTALSFTQTSWPNYYHISRWLGPQKWESLYGRLTLWLN